MADKDTIFVLSKEDVVGCAREMGIPEEAITDDILAQVKKDSLCQALWAKKFKPP
jgi:hypothetical protein